jgi:putative ABC transport system substrate-binding protein
MKRRDFTVGLASLATFGRAYAQQSAKRYRIAILDPASPVDKMQESAGPDWPHYSSLFRELHGLGYVEGQNLVVDRLFAGGQTEDFAEIVRRAVQWMPDVILVDSTRLALPLKAATSTFPLLVSLATRLSPVLYRTLHAQVAISQGSAPIVGRKCGASVWNSCAKSAREFTR